MTDTPTPPARPERPHRNPGDPWTPGDVAKYYRVGSKTVTRWFKIGRIPSFRTPGGHHRVHDADMQKIIENETRGQT